MSCFGEHPVSTGILIVLYYVDIRVYVFNIIVKRSDGLLFNYNLPVKVAFIFQRRLKVVLIFKSFLVLTVGFF